MTPRTTEATKVTGASTKKNLGKRLVIPNKLYYLCTMENTNTTPMQFTSNPILLTQVNGYLTYLSRTNQDAQTRELADIVRDNDRGKLLAFAKHQALIYGLHHEDLTNEQMTSRMAMAAQLVALIQMF